MPARTQAWLAPIREALDGVIRPVQFFFRDDDVGWRDARLAKLLDVFAEHALPVDLAVIPTSLRGDLARNLRARGGSTPGGIGFHQHGFAHVNHEPIGRKYEFGPARPRALQRRDIAEGQQRLWELLGPSVDPIFTPPWNRCTQTTAECLKELEFEVLSREARSARFAVPGLLELPVRIDWFAHRKGMRLSRAQFGAMMANEVRGGVPVGVMFHHAVMDIDERAAAAALLALIADHTMALASPMRALAGIARPAEVAGRCTNGVE